MEKFRRTDEYGFNFVFEKTLKPHDIIILDMPRVSANKRGINDIGWQADGNVTLYGTLSSRPESTDALWQKIEENHEVNKTISAIKIENNDDVESKIVIRAILN